ncbi:MAG: sigma-54-dependent Fis family transcriptional regulator [Rhodobacteraceae bacterium]|nr:sigma-54-dependent Fis family transcriptional regulator [Paracoccaceae bacterium]
MPETMTIAIVDDEEDMRQSISQWLSLSGYNTETFPNAVEALKKIGADYKGIVVSDIRMPGMDGMAFLKRLMSLDNALPVILITGHGDVPMAVEAMQIGAYDFLEKPFDPDRMSDLARRATQARRLTLDNRQLRRELSDGTVLLRKLVGSSAVMERLREDILDLAQADGHVLIDGETGTGKSLVAHALHACGPRAGKKFLTISCAAFDEADLTARLFGPPPEGQPLPLVEEARGGTLCLEDIEALPISLQARLLSLIGEQEPGETIPVKIIAICNIQDGESRCEDHLRPDLYYRLAAMLITPPPLRQRGEDILTLFTRFSETFAEEYGCPAPEVTAKEAAQLLQAPWPGNVRQLINLAERAVLQSRRGAGSITALLMNDNSEIPQSMVSEGKPLKEYVEAFEKMLIDNTMRRHRGSIAAVMEELSLPRRTLNEKMAKYGLSRSDYL